MTDAFWWILTLVLMAVGLVGTMLPLVPGTTIILGAAVLHHYALGPARSVSWWTLTGLLALTLVSFAIDFISGAIGAQRFGASRWGAVGGFLGAIVGLFFGLPGLFLGPLAGVLLGEMLGGKGLLPAGKSTWGALLGTTAGALGKVVLGFAMIVWFLVAACWR